MARASSSASVSTKKSIEWRPTKMMNMGDLSRDDDFLSHLLVEKLGTGDVPLLVHKMDLSRRLPKVPASELLSIVKRLIVNKATMQNAIRQAVDELLSLHPVQYFLEKYTQQQINAFSTHASRYLELYHPSGCIEISHTSRYSHRTGKSELCILATRPLSIGNVITELKGSMANLTEEEDRELQRTLRNSEIRRDFSVIHSRSMKKNHLFLGPARFVNHDCNNNCELFREGRYITFRVLRPIAIGEEITAHYGDSYFGKRNRHCLCESCERRGVGGYAPDAFEEEPGMNHSDTDGYSSDLRAPSPAQEAEGAEPNNPNERRTRRGVYAVLPDDARRATVSAPPKMPGTSIATPPQESVSSGPSNDILSSNAPRKRGRPTNASKLVGPSSKTIEDLMDLPSISASVSVSTSSPSIRSSSRLAQKGGGITSHTPLTDSKGKGKEIKEEPHDIKIPPPPPKSAPPKQILTTKLALFKQTPPPKVPNPPPSPPRGPDGRLLPTCATCRNILPLIHVDHELVWGFPQEGSSRRKPLAQDCPRCMRHFAIYGFIWPQRDGASGSVPPTIIGRASSTSSEHKRDAPPSHKRRLEEREEPPFKARKVEVKMSDAARKAVRPQISNGKVVRRGINAIDPATGRPRRGRPPNKSSRSSTRSAHAASEDAEPATEDATPTPTVTSAMNISISPTRKPVKLFPTSNIYHNRRTNGQLEKTVKTYVINKISPRVVVRPLPESEDRLRRSARKRGLQAEPVMIERTPPRKLRKGSDPASSPKLDEESFVNSESTARIGFRMGLYKRPNPFSFSKETWSSSVHSVFDDDDTSIIAESTQDVYQSATSDESEYPVTPDDDESSPPVVIDEVDRDEIIDVDSLDDSLLLRKTTLFKPSPFSFAKKRWATSDQEPSDAERFDAIFPPISPPSTTFKLDDTVMDELRIRDHPNGPHTKPVFSLLGKSYSLPLSKDVSWTDFMRNEHNDAVTASRLRSKSTCDVSTRPSTSPKR